MLSLEFKCDNAWCNSVVKSKYPAGGSSLLQRYLGPEAVYGWKEITETAGDCDGPVLICCDCVNEQASDLPELERFMEEYNGKPLTWKLGRFYLSEMDQESFLGVYDPEFLWNGFAQPLFAQSSVDKIGRFLVSEQVCENAAWMLGGVYKLYRTDKSLFGSEELFRPYTVERHVWPIGWNAWRWQVLNKTTT